MMDGAAIHRRPKPDGEEIEDTALPQMKTTRDTWLPMIQLAKRLESGHVKQGRETEKSILSYITNGLEMCRLFWLYLVTDVHTA